MTIVAAAPHDQAAPGSPRAAWIVGVTCWLLGLSSLVLFFSSTAGPLTDDWLFVVTDAGMAAVYGTVASLLLARRRHAVIVFLLVAAVGGGLAALGGAWRQAVLIGRLPAAPLIESLFSVAWVPGTLSLFLVVPWLVRREVDRRAWLQALPGLADHGRLRGRRAADQRGRDRGRGRSAGPRRRPGVWSVRRRSSSGGVTAGVGESEGLAWLAVGTAVMALSFVPLILPYGLVPFWIVPALHLACQSVFPVAILAVVARQRLWGLELSVSRAAVAGALTAVLVAVYVVVSVVISRAIGNQTVASVAATAAVVAALQPSRLWLQRRVRRMVYGEGADPTAVAARMGSDARPGGVGGGAAGLGHRDPRTHAAAGVGDPGRCRRPGAGPVGQRRRRSPSSSR